MNEKIKELWEECKNPDWHQDNQTYNHEKFAELIVRECTIIALEQKKWVEDQVVFVSRDIDWNEARIQQTQHIVDKIKQHFGVEE